MLSFSPGLAQGCFELLGIASRNSLTFPQILASFPQFGTLPTGRISELAQRIGWLLVNDEGVATVSVIGMRLIALGHYQAMLRQALLDYIDIERPPWIQNATYGRARVVRFAARDTAQVFVEAGLVDSTADEVVVFWDSLAALARGQHNQRLSEIGRQGERLSIAYEWSRTGQKPKWTAIDNNADGYDILSIVESTDRRPLSIEVKTSTLGFSGQIHLTYNEWERAIEAENHLFHIWIIRPEGSLLAKLEPDKVKGHIPVNTGIGKWESMQIQISCFKDEFF